MNYEKLSYADFIIDGLNKNYLISNVPLKNIENTLREQSYDNQYFSSQNIDYHSIDEFKSILKKTHPITIFVNSNNIKINKIQSSDEELNMPVGLSALNKQTKNAVIKRPQEEVLLNVILNKNIRRNILLIGEPGVGKTHLISNLDHHIIRLDLASLISGTSYRGSFESKLDTIIKFSQQKHIILFIDEIHSLYNLGLSEGGISALNILKPYLASGEITIIGATTPSELSILKKDPAFLRRFTEVDIPALSRNEVYKHSSRLLDQFKIHFSNDVILFMLDKSEELYGENRILDGFIDLSDTINSYFTLKNMLSPTIEDLLEMEFIWEKIYVKK